MFIYNLFNHFKSKENFIEFNDKVAVQLKVKAVKNSVFEIEKKMVFTKNF